MMAVSLKEVSKFYGSRPGVLKFSLEVTHGERLVLIGPSGCGKTTVLRLIAGFIAPDEGDIFLEGALVATRGKVLVGPEKRGVGMVFQDLALWPHMSVEKNISFGLWRLSKRERKRRVREMLEMVGLEAYAKARPHELSGGQQQRVALARALAPQPRLLLMDEPLSNLDPQARTHLRRELRQLHKDMGFSLIYVTHDMEDASEIATRTVVMR